MAESEPTFATMFSSGELFGVGAQEAGYTHVWGIEKDDKAAKVARLNGFNVYTADVLDFVPHGKHKMKNSKTGQIIKRTNHGHASPPCQNASVAKTDGRETAGDIALAEAVALFIRIFEWDTFTLENVVFYRKFKSFKIIMDQLHKLGYWTEAVNLNSADFGVPQTRNRLIVRAGKKWLAPYPSPVKWVGWYEAIEDLIPELPDSEFAPWQIARLPEEHKEFLLGNGERSTPIDPHEPMHTVTANNNQTSVRALITRGAKYKEETERGRGYRFEEEPAPTVLVKNTSMKGFLMAGAGNTNFNDAEPGKGVRYEEEPAHVVAAGTGGRIPRAYVLSGDNRGDENGMRIKDQEEPIFTIKANAGTKAPVRAFLANGGNSNANSFAVRESEEPHHTVTASMDRTPSRAHVGGRVVKMSIKALGRFQSVPDWYQGLTVKINGNGFPPLMAKGVMLTLKDQYQ